MSSTKILPSQIFLHQALLALLLKKPLEKITVRELCEKAGVNRTTFYHHYERPIDILYEIIQQFADSAFPEDITSDSLQMGMVSLLSKMETHLALSRALLQTLPSAYLSEYILHLPQVDCCLSKKLSAFSISVPKESIRSFLVAGSVQLIADWLLQDTRCSPQEEANLIFCLCEKFLIV